jgi:hypothetical protein
LVTPLNKVFTGFTRHVTTITKNRASIVTYISNTTYPTQQKIREGDLSNGRPFHILALTKADGSKCTFINLHNGHVKT